MCTPYSIFIVGCFLATAYADGRDRSFLRKKSSSKQDGELWNAFLQSERAPPDNDWTDGADSNFDTSSTGSVTAGESFLDASLRRGNDQGRQGRVDAALRSCLKRLHLITYLEPVPVVSPHRTWAAIADAAIDSLKLGSSKYQDVLMKARLQACLETSQDTKTTNTVAVSGNVGRGRNEREALLKHASASSPIIASGTSSSWSSFGSKSKNSTRAAPEHVARKVLHLLETNASADGCTTKIKQCRKDRKNCAHVLDILQFLRLQHVGVEKTIQREADARLKDEKHTQLLKTLLEERGLAVPRAEDWEWVKGSFLQNALDENAPTLPNHDWQWMPPPRLTVGNFPIPNDDWKPPPPTSQLHHELPQTPEKSANATGIVRGRHVELPPEQVAQPVKLSHLGAGCSAESQKELQSCEEHLKECKIDVKNHETILNNIAERAHAERMQKLQPLQQSYLRPS